MMLSGFFVSCASPAAARFNSRRWVFNSLARSRRNWRSADLLTLRRARATPSAATPAKLTISVRVQKSASFARKSGSVERAMTKPWSPRLASIVW